MQPGQGGLGGWTLGEQDPQGRCRQKGPVGTTYSKCFPKPWEAFPARLPFAWPRLAKALEMFAF